ncbi:hypothetical protein ACFODZ_09330 [Marinicella sediminis]|uniref:Toxin co-regulated pilus biosynthesis protein Q C-terminal domain-containing protein n=1 Tax=Marinicella sediminis TaxID=1792834 RepID=A0ABV7JCN0_9GAMM|nr:hypothetical protein [Marinicella sediminis]
MEHNPANTLWQHQPFLTHWLKHAVIPVVILVSLLALPKPWIAYQEPLLPVLELTITPQTSNPVQDTEQPKPKPVEPSITPKTASKPPPTQSVAPANRQKPQPQSQITSASLPSNPSAERAEAKQPEAAEPNTHNKLTSGDILLMASKRTSVAISADFQARSGPAKNFYIPQQEIENWLNDIPFLDESVDQPTIQMRFYPDGIEGHIEKFFDKITISKTFTTKYGTKIHCALIGVIAACSWK